MKIDRLDLLEYLNECIKHDHAIELWNDDSKDLTYVRDLVREDIKKTVCPNCICISEKA